jgi:cytochrome c-type biogenesis protein CcmH/NrfG
LQQGHAAAGAECFEKAFALGGRGPRMLWDYGQMLLASRPKDAVRVFNELVAIEPKRMDARIELAAAQLQDGQPVAAGQILTSIMKSVSPAEAPRFLVIGAYVDLAQGQREAARTVVERLRRVAATEQDRTALAELERRLDQPEPTVGITPDHR